MKNKLHLSFLLLEIVCWFLFIGLAIETGGYLSNTIITLFVKPEWASHFWGFMDLSNLFQFDLGLFICLTSLLITVSLLKTILFYKTILIFHKKKFNLDHPFNPAIQDFLFHFCYIVFAIGLFTYAGSKFSNWLLAQGVLIPTLEKLNLGGADVWIFMGVTLLLVAKIFKKGIEIQNENDLTI